MDVRCDRCETEYELDDAIVTDAGTSVQCTTCGHTFIVTRGSSSPLAQTTSTGGSTVGLTPPGGITDGPGPEVLEWTLSTDDGKVHRFRDLTVLQKWVVERKVTRSDQVSRSGGPWLSLADVVELAPFFKVVDEADRARATTISSPGMTSMPGMVSAAQSRAASGPVRMPAVAAIAPPLPPAADPIRPVSEDGPTVPNRRLPGTLDGPSIPQPGIRPPDSRAPAPRVPAEARLPGMGGAA
ncbi:MAG: zinc-ribbon domain-containing protein, partial [Bacteroidota bacterium]